VSDHTSDPATIERDLGNVRTRLSNHLDELSRRLSPGQLLDEGLAYVRDGQGAAFMRNLGSGVRDNPLPVALTGIGLTWLAFASSMSVNGGGSRAMVPYDQAQAWRDAADDVAGRAQRAGEALTRTAGETQDAFQERVAEARARVLGLQRDASETAAVFADRVQQAMTRAQQSMRASLETAQQSVQAGLEGAQRGVRAGMNRVRRGTDAVGDAAQWGRDYAARTGSGVSDALGDNPLLLGALGIAAGALLGALLPRSSQEEAVIGPAAGWAANAAREAADEVVTRGARAADAAATAAYQAAVGEQSA
jgi:Protein of unknown function (DUF3618)